MSRNPFITVIAGAVAAFVLYEFVLANQNPNTFSMEPRAYWDYNDPEYCELCLVDKVFAWTAAHPEVMGLAATGALTRTQPLQISYIAPTSAGSQKAMRRHFTKELADDYWVFSVRIIGERTGTTPSVTATYESTRYHGDCPRPPLDDRGVVRTQEALAQVMVNVCSGTIAVLANLDEPQLGVFKEEVLDDLAQRVSPDPRESVYALEWAVRKTVSVLNQIATARAGKLPDPLNKPEHEREKMVFASASFKPRTLSFTMGIKGYEEYESPLPPKEKLAEILTKNHRMYRFFAWIYLAIGIVAVSILARHALSYLALAFGFIRTVRANQREEEEKLRREEADRIERERQLRTQTLDAVHAALADERITKYVNDQRFKGEERDTLERATASLRNAVAGADLLPTEEIRERLNLWQAAMDQLCLAHERITASAKKLHDDIERARAHPLFFKRLSPDEQRRLDEIKSGVSNDQRFRARELRIFQHEVDGFLQRLL